MFINVRPGRSKGFFAAEVSDLNGRLHTLDGVWAPDLAGAHLRFEKVATDWDRYDAPSDEVLAARTAEIVEQCRIWGCE